MANDVESIAESISHVFHEQAKLIETNLPEVWERALGVFKDQVSAVRFMTEGNQYFDGKSPYETAQTDSGKQSVMTYLGRVQHNVFF